MKLLPALVDILQARHHEIPAGRKQVGFSQIGPYCANPHPGCGASGTKPSRDDAGETPCRSSHVSPRRKGDISAGPGLRYPEAPGWGWGGGGRGATRPRGLVTKRGGGAAGPSQFLVEPSLAAGLEVANDNAELPDVLHEFLQVLLQRVELFRHRHHRRLPPPHFRPPTHAQKEGGGEAGASRRPRPPLQTTPLALASRADPARPDRPRARGGAGGGGAGGAARIRHLRVLWKKHGAMREFWPTRLELRHDYVAPDGLF